jgi:hypothetical protein
MLIKSEHQEYHKLASHVSIGNVNYFIWFRGNVFIKKIVEWGTVKQTLNQLVKE